MASYSASMDSYMDSKKTRTRKKKTSRTNPAEFIRGKYNQYIEVSREVNPNLPSQWLDGSDKLIDLISTKIPVEECVGLWAITLDMLQFILEKEDPLDECVIKDETAETKVVFNWYYLFELIRDKKRKEIQELCKSNGELIVALGYLSIYVISLYRIFLYLEDNPTPRDSLYIFYGNELEKDPQTKILLEKAIERLCRYIAYNYMGKEDRDYDIKPYYTPWNYELLLNVNKVLKDDIVNNLIMAAEGDEKLKEIANSVKFDLINEYTKYRKYEKGRYDYKNYQKIENLINTEKLSNASELQEAEVLPNLQSMKNWIDKVPDPIDRKILNYKYFNKLPLREIGEKVGMSHVAVKKRVDKLNPPF